MKKSIKLTAILFLSVLAISLNSCKDDDESEPKDTNHAYMGSWGGTFTGDDSGTWNMVTDKDGKFTGDLYSNNGQSTTDFDGSIDDKGVFSATIDMNGVILDFTGQGTNGNAASGTWENPSLNLTGTWTGTKK